MVACDQLVAALQQPVVAVVGVTGEYGLECQACRNLLVQWPVRLAAVHHHLVLHDDAAVVDRREDGLGRLERSVGPVGESAAGSSENQVITCAILIR